MAIEVWRPGRGLRPWSALETMEELERRFDEIFGRPSLFPSMWRRPLSAEMAWVPPVDMIEKEDKFEVKVELPGIKKEDIDISVTGNTLTIKGERKAETEVKEEEYYCCERSYGNFFRSLTIPASVDTDKIEAKYKDGILEIELPKSPEVTPKKIDVKVK